MWIHVLSCADPENFARGGPTLTTQGREDPNSTKRGPSSAWIQIALKEGHHRPASERPFKWRFSGGLMMAQH